jgi:hypothetical protein
MFGRILTPPLGYNPNLKHVAHPRLTAVLVWNFEEAKRPQ